VAVNPHENASPPADNTRDEATLAQLKKLLHSVRGRDLRLITLDGESLAMPDVLRDVLSEATDALARGEAVTLAPLQPEISVSQAAILLGISQPHLVKLLDDGVIPSQFDGTHRRVNLLDLYAYKEHRRQRSQRLLQDMTRIAEESVGGYD